MLGAQSKELFYRSWYIASPRKLYSFHNAYCRTCSFELISNDKDRWKSELFNDRNNVNGNKLRAYRLFKSNLETEHYVSAIMPRAHLSILAKFRSGSLPLLIETGRYSKVPLQNRICKLCNSNQIEDELHFLLNCEFFEDLRRPLLFKAQRCNTDFARLNNTDEFIFLMNHINLTHILAWTLFEMFKRRKQFLFLDIFIV